MIGIGKWEGSVNTMLYSGEVSFRIVDKNGEYDVEFDLPEGVTNAPQFSISEVEESGNTLNAKVDISLLPGKKVDISMDFDGDTMNGVIKIPFIGKVKLENFKRIG